MKHISDHDLERYYLGMIPDGPESATLEEHLLSCPKCVSRAYESDVWVDTIRAAIVEGEYDLEY